MQCVWYASHQNTALSPIIDLLQRTLQWQPGDGPQVSLEKLERLLQPYQLPLAETLPLFATLLSRPVSEDRYPPPNLTPQRQRQKTLETIIAMVLQQAERRPVLFIQEDLHWTDPSTLELLNLLIDDDIVIPNDLATQIRKEIAGTAKPWDDAMWKVVSERDNHQENGQ